MRPRTRISLGLLFLSLAVSVGMGWFLQQRYERYIVSRGIVIAAVPIPPYTKIDPQMLRTKDLPKLLSKEPIYLTAGQVVGLITRAPIPAGSLIYRDIVVQPARFRFVDDPSLEVISFPVDPDKAVGGQIQTFQRINLYRIAHTQTQLQEDPTRMLTDPAAATELLAEHALVVDVRTKRGGAVANTETASSAEERAKQARAYQQALQIITVAVPPETAHEITRLMGELHTNYDLWVSLAPVGTPSPEEAVYNPTPWPTPTNTGNQNPGATRTRTPRPTFTPRSTFTPRPTSTKQPIRVQPMWVQRTPTSTPYPFDIAIPSERMQRTGPEGKTNTIRGTVVTTGGALLTGHKVFLRYCCPEGRLVYPPRGTNQVPDGHFEFTVTPGSYWLEVEGLATQDREIYVPPEGATWTILAVQVP